MSKRHKGSDDDNQSDQGLDNVNSGGGSNMNSGGNLSENDSGNNDRPATNQLLSQNGLSNSILDGRTVKIQPGNNQNDNSNSSSIGNSNSANNPPGGINQPLNKSKKERADNWSTTEIQVLHREIELRRDIFYGPPNQATKKNRELAWEAITNEINAVSSTPRTLSQVMKKFKNEKCRAKRKFVDPDKDGHNNSQLIGGSNNTANVSNINNDSATTTANDVNTNLRVQQQTTNHNVASSNQQQQQLQQHQAHLMATAANAGGSSETMTTPQATSINVVKLAPQNVAKTMIDLPGHVQHTIQMPNDDMVLIVPPDMDGLLSGVNIVSDALGNHQHSHHNQHAIQTLNTNQGLMNGTVGNSMMARTIPAGSMCSLVYSTGSDVCGPEHHITAGQGSIAPNHIAMGAQSLVHARGSNLDQGQQHRLHHTSQAPHQQHQQQQHHPQQQQQRSQQHQQQQQQHQHPHLQHHHHHHQQQQHAQNTHPESHSIHHQHLTQNTLASSTSSAAATMNATNPGGFPVESQLKNLLFNLLLKDGQHSSMPNTINFNQDYSKQRNDMLAIIASSLTKIESHLSKISKVAGALFNQNTSLGESITNQLGEQAQQLINSSASVSTANNVSGDGAGEGLAITSDNNNNNSFNISNPGPAHNITSNQRNND